MEDLPGELRKSQDRISALEQELTTRNAEFLDLVSVHNSLDRKYSDLAQYAAALETRLHVLRKVDLSQMQQCYAFVNQNYSVAFNILSNSASEENYSFTVQSVDLVRRLLLSLRKIIGFQQNKFAGGAATAFEEAEASRFEKDAFEDTKRYAEEVVYLKQQIRDLNYHITAISFRENPALLTKHSLTIGNEQEVIEWRYQKVITELKVANERIRLLETERLEVNENLIEEQKLNEKLRLQLEDISSGNDKPLGETTAEYLLSQTSKDSTSVLNQGAKEQIFEQHFESAQNEHSIESIEDSAFPESAAPTATLSETQNIQHHLDEILPEMRLPVLIPQIRTRERQFETNLECASMLYLETNDQKIMPNADGSFTYRKEKIRVLADCLVDEEERVINFTGMLSFHNSIFNVQHGIIADSGLMSSKLADENKKLAQLVTAMEVKRESLAAELSSVEHLLADQITRHSLPCDKCCQVNESPIMVPQDMEVEALVRENCDLKSNIGLFVEEREQLNGEVRDLKIENAQLRRLEDLVLRQSQTIDGLMRELLIFRQKPDCAVE